MRIDSAARDVNGVPVWQLPTLGGVKRAAAYLWFNKQVGDRFTIREIREAIGTDGRPDTSEHLNRRLRDLRDDDWVMRSYKDVEGLGRDEYELSAKGLKVWAGEANPRATVSPRLRREVLERDGHRCVLCGVGSNEPYPGEPGSKARMTVGHMRPQARAGSAARENLRTECARCNEPLRDALRDAETVGEVLAAIRGTGARDRALLRQWIDQGFVTRSPVMELYDRVRVLAREDQLRIAQYLH
ncbi:MAG: HNH endonuclease signature motif containing protein [Micropruina sp.]